ncbi:CoA ester lyase [Pseudomonas synxantha]|uniref:CoA ester lyase n=1 Tax=Pseudomonas synxantha TaxID=47883 RepID=A0ABS0UPS4_9PSED|nr:CoA ester lyase [Pseudomonas synxantha]MBI6567601.1 CoA ester lyase [Pseudomonas synxantha]MBI6582284.1 CoA ester lyase [Pseudomonas synxantha]MBI6645473.1 CoA ester lyase [Pseudomonas synxantha]
MQNSMLRTALFVPGNRPERFAKALAAGADAVIVDFEDAVQEADKATARDNLAYFLAEHPHARVWVRVNCADHPLQVAELALCASLPGIVGILLPKAESAEQVRRAAETGKAVMPIIESALGLAALPAIAKAPGVGRLTYGGLDLSLDLGLHSASPGAERMLDQARFALLLQSRLAGLPAPLETVFAKLDEHEALTTFIGDAQAMGFAGMLCIHPAQVAVVHRALQPTARQLDWARRVLDGAQGNGAFQVDGQMVDAPVLQRARNLLAASAR